MTALPIASLFITIALALLVTRTATVALAMTGMSREAARFQARSAFSGSGFTTAEAEQVVNHPVRRRIVMLLMLLGNLGFVTVVTSLILSFVGGPTGGNPLGGVLVLVGGLGVLWFVGVSGWIDRLLCRPISWALKKWTDLDVHDYSTLLQFSQGYGIAETTIEHGDWMLGKTIGQLDLESREIVVLGIRSGEGSYNGAPGVNTPLVDGDTLVIYGRSPKIGELCGKRTH